MSWRISRSFVVCSLGLILAACSSLRYPPARRDGVVDDYHGTKVPDPYRWLEDADSPETQAWVEEENKLTTEFVSGPLRDRLRARYEQLWNFPKYTIPFRHGEYYFFQKNDGLQNQSVLYAQKGLAGEPLVVLDPNKLSADGTISLGSHEFSHDGTLMAYGLQSSGSDEEELHVLSVVGGEKHADVLKWCKFTSIAWRHDNDGFFYDRYPDPATVAKEDQNRFNRVYYHKLGTPQSQDPLICERPDDKDLSFAASVTEDGKYLVLSIARGTDPRNLIYYRPVDSTQPFVKLIDKEEARYQFIDNVGPIFYFHTNLDAPRGRIIAIDVQNPDRAKWKEVIPQQQDVLSSAAMGNDQLITVYMQDAHNRAYVYARDGKLVREIPLPRLGSVDALSAKREDRDMFISFESFVQPPTAYKYDLSTGQMAVFRKTEVKFDPAGYETKQVFYPSKDGTRVPMFIVHRKGLKLDGNNPTLLYGYGGFNISLTPYFSTGRLIWLENGGVYAIANLRGGEEYGEDWHQAGMLARKQNVFDDFIAAAEWLIKNGYTSTRKLAINGGSNGGLLVAACEVQRPDLFGAVVCQVPVADMLRYDKFTVGSFWVPEYGTATNPEQFKFLYAYSPLHNVKSGTRYPPTLITTADHDDRVVPSHGKKLAAALQAANAGPNPILLRVDTKAGHGGGKPTAKILDELADTYAFLFKVLKVK